MARRNNACPMHRSASPGEWPEAHGERMRSHGRTRKKHATDKMPRNSHRSERAHTLQAREKVPQCGYGKNNSEIQGNEPSSDSQRMGKGWDHPTNRNRSRGPPREPGNKASRTRSEEAEKELSPQPPSPLRARSAPKHLAPLGFSASEVRPSMYGVPCSSSSHIEILQTPKDHGRCERRRLSVCELDSALVMFV